MSRFHEAIKPLYPSTDIFVAFYPVMSYGIGCSLLMMVDRVLMCTYGSVECHKRGACRVIHLLVRGVDMQASATPKVKLFNNVEVWDC